MYNVLVTADVLVISNVPLTSMLNDSLRWELCNERADSTCCYVQSHDLEKREGFRGINPVHNQPNNITHIFRQRS